MEQPVVSVVIVSDYRGGDDKGWQDLADTLAALSRQDFAEPVEFLLAENEASPIPVQLLAILPSLRVVTASENTSFGLKTAGVSAANADIIGILDGDCVPHDGWLRSMVASLRDNPAFAVVSGRTSYPGKTTTERIYGMLARGYLDRGNNTAETDSVANNNCGFRRDVILNCPFPGDIGPFGERLHVEDIKRAGHRMLFNPGMLVTHAYEGWQMERDIRRNSGFAAVKVRQINPQIRFATVTRLGLLGIPLFVVGRTLYDCWTSIRWGRHYAITWYQQPLAMAMAVLVHFLEIPGMTLALRGRSLDDSAYR